MNIAPAKLFARDLYKLYLYHKIRAGRVGNKDMMNAYLEAWKVAACYVAWLEQHYPLNKLVRERTWEEVLELCRQKPFWPLYDEAPHTGLLRRGRIVAESDHLVIWLTKDEVDFVATGDNTGLMGPYLSIREAYQASHLEDEYYYRREYVA